MQRSGMVLSNLSGYGLKEAIAFCRIKTRIPNDSFQLETGQGLIGLRSRHVADLFLQHGPIQVIGSKIKRQLGQFQRQHDPVGFDVGKIIQLGTDAMN
jgi:hypothetical protein